MRRSFTLAAVAAFVLVACQPDPPTLGGPGQASPTNESPIETITPRPSGDARGSRPNRNQPPPVMVTGDTTVELDAWSYCYGNRCVSGSPPKNPPEVGNPDQVVVNFALPGWGFDAMFSPAGEECGRMQRVRLDEAGDARFLLRPIGFAGTYDVTLWGRGDGSLSTTFRWTTPEDGPLPEPKARLAILADDGGQETSYGIELEITNLEATPEDIEARIYVRSSEGNAISFTPSLSRGRQCIPEGTLYFDRPDDKGSAATELGDRPFIYKVVLRLDGKRYFARAVWPRDQIPGNHPSVRLRFTPELPALGD